MGGIVGSLFELGGNIAGSVVAGGIGRKQQKEGQSMISEAQKLSASYKRPEMLTPEAIQMMMRLAKGQMYQKLPGSTEYENQIQGATSAGMSAIEDMGAGSEGMGAIAGLYGNQMGQFQNLAAQNAGFQQQGQQNYMGALEGLGDWQQQQWKWNKADPYIMAQQKASQLETAGRMNQFQGYKTRAGAWAEGLKGAGSTIGGMIDDNGEDIMKLLGIGAGKT
jgi:hypothetical protein